MSDIPFYIVSKGRWESRLTHKALSEMGVKHFLVIEEQEYPSYKAVVGPLASILILDPEYQYRYNTCDDLGDTKSKGPGPARNFVWDHANQLGAEWHWVMDDNIREFLRFNRNMQTRTINPGIFRSMEAFVNRYTNISMAGPQYYMFVPRKVPLRPFNLNTRIYSCNLIKNSVKFRWRGRYNEDTDLSLRILKSGRCTVEFNAFLQMKTPTQRLNGGNTDEFYRPEGTLPKSQMQVKLHPDVSRLAWKYKRWHHHVDYSGFTQPLIRRTDIEIPTGINDFGMVYQEKVGDRWG